MTNDKNIDKISLENFGEVKEMSTVKVGENESLESAIKRFKRKCQKDGIRVVASERILSTKDDEFGKKKSMYQQKKITKYTRKIKTLSNIKAN